MSYIKAHYLPDPCQHCHGSGELITPISIPTTHHNFPGYAYDETWEPCGACNGTGQADMAPAHLEQTAEEHELITEQKEHQAWTF